MSMDRYGISSKEDILNKLITVAAFGLGAALGSVVTWKIVDGYYAKIAQEEIESVKRAFRRREEKSRTFEESGSDIFVDDNIPQDSNDEVVETTSNEESDEEIGYLSDDDEPTRFPKTTDWSGEDHWIRDLKPEPYIIDDDEFASLPDYAVVPLTYYADKILADDQGIIIEDIDRIVGDEAMLKLSEKSAVYVRNDMIKCDYEITEDERGYFEAVADKGVKEIDK